ncbi:daptide-type RiPP [Actinoplanes sp. NPDC051859]|uniref:daptide-type RiPP n=1 Tax=Actinoplanes sp. NPDC051859 TaxID=3363909 RepID=UPI0037B3E78C
MSENLDVAKSGKDEAELELEMQELEVLEAPGFWTGVSIGAGISSAVAVSVASIT